MKQFFFRHALLDDRGTSAIEFAIVGPVFFILVIGMLYTCLLLFSMGSMQYAVEEGARCASVKSTVCTDSNSTVTYTQGKYFGPLVSPTFTSSNSACGHVVSGTASFVLNMGSGTLTVPLNAHACFP